MGNKQSHDNKKIKRTRSFKTEGISFQEAHQLSNKYDCKKKSILHFFFYQIKFKI